MARLEVRKAGETAKTTYYLPKRSIIIGRSEDCDLILEDRQKIVSREHAQIEYYQGDYFINDLNSKNGTFVNQTLITKPTQLNDGDNIAIGRYNIIFKARKKPVSGTAVKVGVLSAIIGLSLIYLIPKLIPKSTRSLNSQGGREEKELPSQGGHEEALKEFMNKAYENRKNGDIEREIKNLEKASELARFLNLKDEKARADSLLRLANTSKTHLDSAKELYDEQGEHLSSASLFRQVLRRYPNNNEARKYIERILQDMFSSAVEEREENGDIEREIENLENASELARFLNLTDEESKIYGALLARADSLLRLANTSKNHLDKAKELYKQGEYPESSSLARQVLERYPNNAEARNLITNPPEILTLSSESEVIGDTIEVAIEVAIGGTITFGVTASDPDNDSLAYSWDALHGTIKGSGSEVEYSPAETIPDCGVDQIVLAVSDGMHTVSDTISVQIKIADEIIQQAEMLYRDGWSLMQDWGDTTGARRNWEEVLQILRCDPSNEIYKNAKRAIENITPD